MEFLKHYLTAYTELTFLLNISVVKHHAIILRFIQWFIRFESTGVSFRIVINRVSWNLTQGGSNGQRVSFYHLQLCWQSVRRRHIYPPLTCPLHCSEGGLNLYVAAVLIQAEPQYSVRPPKHVEISQ